MFGGVTDAEIEATETLRQELGSNYEQFIKDGAQGLQKLFPSQAQAAEVIRQSGILNDREALGDAMRLLAKIGKSRR